LRGFLSASEIQLPSPKFEKSDVTMSEQPLYRWLEQQGEAFGAPGMAPRWTSSVKDAWGRLRGI